MVDRMKSKDGSGKASPAGVRAGTHSKVTANPDVKLVGMEDIILTRREIAAKSLKKTASKDVPGEQDNHPVGSLSLIFFDRMVLTIAPLLTKPTGR